MLSGVDLSGLSSPISPELEELADRIASLNLIEVGQLVDALKCKLGIDDAELFMPAGGFGGPAVGAGTSTEDAEPEVEKTHFDLKLDAFDAKSKIKIIKEVRGLTGLGLKEAKELVESVPATIMSNIKKEEAAGYMDKLKELGAEVSLE
jgi:large subunit ribosomal protein L7/L12